MLVEVERGQDGPFAKYYDDPVGFFPEVLGRQLWSKQEAIARAVASDPQVSVRSGNGVGKTFLAAGLALWFWATRGPGARVFLTSAKKEQADEAVWKEVRLLFMRANRLADERRTTRLSGILPRLGTTGLHGPDEQKIMIIAADKDEAMAGMRGAEMMVIADEASVIPDRLFAAMHGMLSGGGRLLLIGNPMRSSGYFYDSQKPSSDFVKFHISVLETPNVKENRTVIEGLTDPGWPERRAREWGVDSAWYQIRVLGNFVENEEGKLFPAPVVAAAKELLATTPPIGRLHIGIDPAGDGEKGDDSAFVCRRGKHIFPPLRLRGISPDAHVAHALGLIGIYQGGYYEKPMLLIDREGPVGAKVYGAFLVYLAAHPEAFDLIGIRGSEHAKRRPFEINRLRDEIWLALLDAFRDGLAIPEDAKLEGDLDAIRFQKLNAKGKAEVEPKDVVRRLLGRSPDTGDALALACWIPYDPGAQIEAQIRAADIDRGGAAIDPYAARSDRIFDPYAGHGGGGDPYGGNGRRGERDDYDD
jgi:hypothetical protein